jgi:hypothetical protein
MAWAIFLAACFVPACLRAGFLFHSVVAWTAKVLAICGSGWGTMPAVTDLDGLDVAPPMEGGKTTLPSAFLDLFGPSELWKAFHVSMANAWMARALMSNE